MTHRANVLLAGFLSLPLLWAGAPVLRASGDWLETSTVPTDDLGRPPASAPFIREAAPVSPPPRPAVPSMPSLNQEIRR